MSIPDNVVKMASKLERLAERANKAARAYEAGNSAAIAAVIEYGRALLEGRTEFASDKEFGQWVKANGLDRIKPFDEQQERTAAMKIAEISTQGTFPLGSCPRSRPTDIMTWWRNQRREKNVKIANRKPRKVEAALADAKAFQDEHHRLPTERDMNERGHSDGSASAAKAALKIAEEVRAEEAVKREQAIKDALEAAAAKTITFTKAQQAHVDAAIRRRTKELEKDFAARKALLEKTFWAEVGKACDANEAKRFPLLQARENEAFETKEHYTKMIRTKAFFTRDQAKTILMCLHPDGAGSRTKEKLNEAFLLFNAKFSLLTGELG